MHLAAITLASKQVLSMMSTQQNVRISMNNGGNDERSEEQHIIPTTAPLDELGSICHNLIRIYPGATKVPENNGQLPMHLIALSAVTWNTTIQCLYDAYPSVMHIRANGKNCFSQCPIHMVCTNPNATESLVENVVRSYRRGAMLIDANGKLPFHLAIERGKTWEGGLQALYDAYPRAIETREDNNHRRWLPLHCAVSSPYSSLHLIQKILEIYPQAVKEVDGYTRTALHLAVESGKDWDSGVNFVFEKYPDAILKFDSEMKTPFFSAAIKSSHNLGQLKNDQDIDLRETKLEVMFQILKAAPHIIQDFNFKDLLW